MTTKNDRTFTCEPCQYTTTSSSNFNRHINTAKHARIVSRSIDGHIKSPLAYACTCGKKYSHRGSLYNHKLNCTNQTTQFSTVSKITNDYCDAIRCCDIDKEIIHVLVSKYISDARKYMSSQFRCYLKQRDKISDPVMKNALDKFYQTNMSIEHGVKSLVDSIPMSL